MRMTKKFCYLVILGYLLSVFFISNLFSQNAQTHQVSFIWDKNKEADMYLYRLYKGPDANHLSKIDSIFHPDTTYTDVHLNKGVLYYYGLTAVDSTLLESEMSDLVTVGIPEISGIDNQMVLPADTTVTLNLDNYVNDPDNADDQLVWSISGFSHVQVTISGRSLTIKTPSNWTGSENGNLKVEDPDKFFDQIVLTITVENQPPVFATIPQLETLEDKPIQINLAQYVNDADSPHDSLTYSVGHSSHLNLNLQDSLLTVTPEKDWYGTAKFDVKVQDEDGLMDSTTITLVVQAVDDAPILSKLPNIRMGQDTTITLNLDDYVWDVDNSKSELQWKFANYSHVTISFSQETHNLVIQSPQYWSGFEYIRISVEDPDQKMSFDTLVVQVEKISYAPQLSSFPKIVFNEDQSDSLNLNNFVSDKDTPLGNLYWEVDGNQNVQYKIDNIKKMISFKADSNWFGNETFWIKVMDPDQHADSTQVSVNVLPVNDPPSFKQFPAVDLSLMNPRSFAYREYLSDVDDAVENLQLHVLSAGSVQITIKSESISFQVDDNWFGTQKVKLMVQDASDATDTTDVLVYRQNIQKAPRIVNLDSVELDEDHKITIPLNDHITDPDNSSNEITWSLEAPACLGAQLNVASGDLIIQPIANWNGQELLILKATDPQGNFDYDTLTVVVKPVNDPPQIQSIPDETMLAGTYFILDLTQYLSDPDGYEDLQQVELLNNPQSFIGYYLNNLQATFFAPQGFHGQETFMVRATDKAGKQAVAIFVLRVWASSIESGVDVHPFGSGTLIQLDWNSSIPTKDQLEYSLDWSFKYSTPMEAEFNTKHHTVLDNLEPNKTYHFRVISLDQQGMVITNPDSVFKTGQKINGVNVFPIPFKAHDAASGEGIYFTNLGKSAKIFIFNLLGDLVYKKEIQGPIYKWDIRNNNGQYVHSGLYLYQIKTKGKTYRGKLIIIR